MTIIAACRESADALLIAADTEANADGIRQPGYHKLRAHPTMPIAWGCAGYESVHKPWAQWLYERSFKSWANLEGAAARRLRELNKSNRQAARDSGFLLDEKRNSEFAAEALIVGWLGGEPRTLALFDSGELMWATDIDVCLSIGVGHHYFKLICNALRYVVQDDPLALMRIGMRATAETAPNCGLPVDMWRVTPEGRQEMT